MGRFYRCKNCDNTEIGDDIYRCENCGRVFCEECIGHNEIDVVKMSTWCPHCGHIWKKRLGSIENTVDKDDDDEQFDYSDEGEEVDYGDDDNDDEEVDYEDADMTENDRNSTYSSKNYSISPSSYKASENTKSQTSNTTGLIVCILIFLISYKTGIVNNDGSLTNGFFVQLIALGSGAGIIYYIIKKLL